MLFAKVTQMNQQAPEKQNIDPTELPFVAPCRTLSIGAPLRWLRMGWNDLKQAPRQSLTYGFALCLLGYGLIFIGHLLGNLYTILGIMSGFILVGPFVAIGLYSISCQLQDGRVPVLGYCLREGGRHIGNVILYGFILLVVFLLWARAASMLNIFYPVNTDASWNGFLLYLGIGSVVGTLFCAIIFCASAFSLPMIMDRDTDMITAVVTSTHAVLSNKKVMFVWALIIVLSVLIGFATALLGFIILLPVIGHGVWHAYQETIDARQWPRH
jgi:uncharacterized membrane protein